MIVADSQIRVDKDILGKVNESLNLFGQKNVSSIKLMLRTQKNQVHGIGIADRTSDSCEAQDADTN